MSNIKIYLEEADSYFSIIGRSLNGPQKLGNNVLISLSSIAVEKYLVSFLLAKSIPIQGHSIKNLINQVEKYLKYLPQELASLSEIDERMNLCSLGPLCNSVPNNDEMSRIFENLIWLKDFVYKSIMALKF
jgi:hypothetical protein